MQVAKGQSNFVKCTLGDLLPRVVIPASVAAVAVSGIASDSRQVRPGWVFFAVPGSNHNGLSFVDAAVRAGAVAVLCRDETATGEATLSWRGDVPLVGVPDIHTCLGLAAAEFYGNPSRSLQVTGVTGTNGKSTCAFLLAQLQQLLGVNAGVMGTLGFGLIGEKLRSTGMTTPDAISCQRVMRTLVDQQAQALAMEVSSHALAQKRTAGIQFQTAIFTNLSRDHLDYHGDMYTYAQAKAQLFRAEHLQHAVINLDDEATAGHMMAALKPGAQLWTFSLRNPGAEVYATDVRLHSNGISAFVRSPWGSEEIHAPLLGEFNLSNLLAVLTAACAQGAQFEQVVACVPRLEAVKGRMQMLDSESDVRVVIDYAHTPDALRQALRALRVHSAGRVHVVFGCGGDRDVGKRPLMAAAAESIADQIIVTSDNPRTESRDKIIEEICSGFTNSGRVRVLADRAEAIRAAVNAAEPGDLVLIAGKGHEDYQIVGLSRLPFDDEAQARLALRERNSERGRL